MLISKIELWCYLVARPNIFYPILENWKGRSCVDPVLFWAIRGSLYSSQGEMTGSANFDHVTTLSYLSPFSRSTPRPLCWMLQNQKPQSIYPCRPVWWGCWWSNFEPRSWSPCSTSGFQSAFTCGASTWGGTIPCPTGGRTACWLSLWYRGLVSGPAEKHWFETFNFEKWWLMMFYSQEFMSFGR